MRSNCLKWLENPAIVIGYCIVVNEFRGDQKQKNRSKAPRVRAHWQVMVYMIWFTKVAKNWYPTNKKNMGL